MRALLSSWRRNHGFTLVEAMVTLALLGVVLTVFAAVVRNMSLHSASLDAKDQVFTASLTALERSARDIKMAVAWTTPAVTNTALCSTLEFDIPDYENDATRIPPPVSGMPALPPWNPLAASGLKRVRFRVNNGVLLRETLTGGSWESVTLATAVVGFSAQRTERPEITVTLGIDAGKQVQSVSQVVHLPLQQCWRTP